MRCNSWTAGRFNKKQFGQIQINFTRFCKFRTEICWLYREIATARGITYRQSGPYILFSEWRGSWSKERHQAAVCNNKHLQRMRLAVLSPSVNTHAPVMLKTQEKYRHQHSAVAFCQASWRCVHKLQTAEKRDDFCLGFHMVFIYFSTQDFCFICNEILCHPRFPSADNSLPRVQTSSIIRYASLPSALTVASHWTVNPGCILLDGDEQLSTIRRRCGVFGDFGAVYECHVLLTYWNACPMALIAGGARDTRDELTYRGQSCHEVSMRHWKFCRKLSTDSINPLRQFTSKPCVGENRGRCYTLCPNKKGAAHFFTVSFTNVHGSSWFLQLYKSYW